MPTSFLTRLPLCYKSSKLTVLFLLSPLFFFGQTLTGLWTGALSNDSTTVRKDQSFEIALTEYKGKVYGYSRSEFIVDDTLYYVMKRVKGTIEGDVCEVSDDEIVAYNFRGKLDKGIKVTSIFRRNKNDSTWYLDGTWKTNATKKYYSVTGKVNLAEEKDLTASKIFPHLEELNLADDVAFYKERKETTSIARVVNPEKIKTEYSTRPAKLTQHDEVTIAVAKPTLERAEATPPIVPVTEPTTTAVTNATPVATLTEENKEEEFVVVKKPVAEVSQKEIKKVDAGSVSVTPTATTKTIAQNKVPVTTTVPQKAAIVATVATTEQETDKKMTAPVVVKNNPTKEPAVVATTKPVENKPVVKTTTVQQNKPEIKSVATTNNPVATQPIAETKKQTVASTIPMKVNTVATTNPVVEKKEVITTPAAVAVIPETKKPEVDILAKAALIAGRKSEFSQIVSFKSDSLELSLYDNGEIDGDTVSVFLNGEVLLSKQGLKSSAIKKTLYITPGNENFTLVLFAENLGKYPPNTGLLVVHDGEDVYNLRFSSDFQKSTGIVFRKKK